MNEICNNYYRLIMDKYGKYVLSIIFYGSNIYQYNSSDLDVCLIVSDVNEFVRESIIEDTIKYHRQNNLKLDDEIPHDNKLVYSLEEVIDTLENPPFYINGKVEISDIKKTKKFLCSYEMKQRLLLNILTTDHLTVGMSTESLENEAFKIMTDIIIRYNHLECFSEDELIECFYKNQYSGASGEMFLGYKRGNSKKEMYLKSRVRNVYRGQL